MTEGYEYAVIGLGALGSATAWQLARRGHRVLGLEQFELDHGLGASHDSSRIIRHSYHSADYVRLTLEAYQDWAQLEADSGQTLLTITGGIDLYPPGAAIGMDAYTTAMDQVGVSYEVMDANACSRRWPQFVLPDGTTAVYQARTGIAPAARGVAAMQRSATAAGAVLRAHSAVTGLRDLGSAGIEVSTDDIVYRVRRLVLTADAWTNQLLRHFDQQIPLTVTQEQVTYFRPPTPRNFAPGQFPVWIWMDDPSFYGFPTYGELTVKAAQDCGGPVVTADRRGFTPDPSREALLADFLAQVIPHTGPVDRSSTCLYTLTPDRDFVLGALPDHESTVVGLGAAHGFKFAPTLGRLLADLATTGTANTTVDMSQFRIGRPALTDPNTAINWLM